jgi:hypothetical protein
VNYIVTAKAMQFPISLARAPTRPVNPVADNSAELRDEGRRQASNYVYRGEVLESSSDRSYKPEYNLQISPENRRAINSYRQTANAAPVVGRILDGYI